MSVPEFTDLSFYSDPSSQTSRYDALKQTFDEKFKGQPDFYVRAPGRVNLIGEHIDYSYFSVIPMAIEKDVVMAIRAKTADMISLVNVDPKFAPAQIEIINGNVNIDRNNHSWSSYFKCGFRVAAEYLAEQNITIFPCGLQVAMMGSVPAGGGLSSSAAFVVAATLATLRANGVTTVDKKLLTKLSITCEQHLGVNTGGMDQAASIFGLKDHAEHIAFRPELAVKPIPFPKMKVKWLIANSLVESHKHDSAPVCYNLRVVEVSVAAGILAKKLNVEIPKDGNLQIGTLRGVMDAYIQSNPETTIKSPRDMLPLVDKFLAKEGYTTESAAKELGISLDKFKSVYLTEFPVRFERLKLWERTTHVYSETSRVSEFESLLLQTSDTTGDVAAQLGKLMNESHYSAQHLFENSHPVVDELVEVARAAGSQGSRVTGAGWGGCTLHLVAEADVVNVEDAIHNFYKEKYGSEYPSDALIGTQPAQGTVIITSLA